jgi:hypothetical protein
MMGACFVRMVVQVACIDEWFKNNLHLSLLDTLRSYVVDTAVEVSSFLFSTFLPETGWLDHFALCLQWDKHKLQNSMCLVGYLTAWYICTLLMQFTKKLFSFCRKSWICPEYIFFL